MASTALNTFASSAAFPSLSTTDIQLIRKWLTFIYGLDWLKWQMDSDFDNNVRYFTRWAHNATLIYLILSIWGSEASNASSMIDSSTIAYLMQGTVLVMNFVTTLTSWTIIHPPTASWWWSAASWQWPAVEWLMSHLCAQQSQGVDLRHRSQHH